MRGSLWEVAVVVVLAAVLLGAANMAYTDQADEIRTNESIDVVHGESIPVSTSASVYSSNVTVEAGGSELTEGEDYRWNAQLGEVYWPTDSSASDGSSADIQYGYFESDDTTDGVATVIASVGWLIWALVLLTILGTLMAWVGLGRGGGW